MNIDVDVGRIRESLRDRSKAIFGKLYRLEVVSAVGASGDPIWSRSMAQALQLPENQVATEIKMLTQLGALRPFPSSHDRRKLYQLVPHPIWPFARELLVRTISELHPDAPDRAVAAYWGDVLALDEPRSIPG